MMKCIVAVSLIAHAVMAQQVETGKPQLKLKGPVKVFILAGQSNMEGQGSVDHDDERDSNGGKGNLVWSMKNSKSANKMKKLKNEKGEWVVREDVQISFKVGGDKILKGGLTVGYTGYAADGSRRHMGPELGFGFVMGDYYQEPVLLIKTAWGGKSLYEDFRPPSSGGKVGPCYTKMVEEVRAAVAELGGQKYEIAGFYWQQGWNDMCEAPAIAEYAQNLVNLVKDLRKEFNVPNMPVVVGELGNGGPVTEGAMFDFRKAQEEGTKQIKNAVFIKTTDFARPPELSPCPTHGHHWCANAESYFLIGEAAGEGMKRLLGVLAAAASGESRPTLKFAGSAPATVAIEEAFKMSLDNLIDINSIPYDPGKWNDTGLLETATDSRFLRAAPAYGENPWVHDGAFNTWSAMNLLEANDGRATRVARNTLWACCDMEDGKPVVNIRESAHSEWYMYQLWNIAAWHYYLVTGDADFLAKAYETATKILAKQEAGHFNAAYGLFEGSFFVGDGISGYPEPPFNPDRHSSNALDYPEVHKALVLSANCVYVGAYKATAAMAKQLGRPQRESDQLTSKAKSVAAAINKHLWMPEQKRYGFFIHGKGTKKAGTLDPSQEGGGLSLAILFGVADVERTKLILANVHRQPKGITMTWPHFARFSDERPGRQNVSVWPQINSLFSQAACIGGRIDLFQSEVENLAGLFRGSGKIREIYHHITGEHCGGYQMNSTGKITLWQAVGNQAWGAGAFCRMIFYGMFGMDFQPDGIRFAPTLPAAWGEVRLGGLRYKGMTLHITLKGEGNAIRSFEINGKSATEPFVSGSLQGEQHVTILLGQRP